MARRKPPPFKRKRGDFKELEKQIGKEGVKELIDELYQLDTTEQHEDPEVNQRFQAAMLHLMDNVETDEDVEAFTKALDAAFYQLRKRDGDEKQAKVIQTLRMMLKDPKRFPLYRYDPYPDDKKEDE